ncbi:MAG: serine/threonine dehydratase [Acidimicrobiales bacterium]
MKTPLVTRSDIDAAAARIAERLRRTPVLTIPGSDLVPSGFPDDTVISLKLEYLQHSGTFKARGAMHFMLTNEIAAAGVTAASGGNHGAAVAWAAQQLGHRATIFVPTISAPAKVAKLRSYGAEVVQVGAVYAESLEACNEHQAASGATSIHAYEAPDVFAGAGTTGREFELQVAEQGSPPLDAVLVACGGGGLVGGIATWFGQDHTADENSATMPGPPTVVACETHDTAAYAEAKKAGQPVAVRVKGIAADALGASTIGTLAFSALTTNGADSVLVDDEAVLAAQRDLWERFRIITEPSAAVPVAAIASGAWRPESGQHVGVVVCGANTSFDNLIR